MIVAQRYAKSSSADRAAARKPFHFENEMPPDQYLSPHFKLYEFLQSQTATRNGIDMTPSTEVIQNLTRVCTLLLEPLRAALACPIQISSGYRPLALNIAIGGATNSAHQFGCAADILVPRITPTELQPMIAKMGLVADLDQCIQEGTWTHLAVADASKPPRRQFLVAKFGPGGARYYPAVFS